MNETNNDKNNNIVGTLRKMTEREDIKQYLKKALIGGYDKNSVLEYITILNKQQQSTAETFSQNQQTLFDEKEALKRECEAVKFRLAQVEAEYRALTAAVKDQQYDTEGEGADLSALRKNIAALEGELDRSRAEISRQNNLIALQKSEIDDSATKLAQAADEKNALMALLKEEKQEARKQSELVTQLTNTLEEKLDEIKFIKAKISDGEIANLRWKINDLTAQLVLQNEMLANYISDINISRKTIETLTQENDHLKRSLAVLTENSEDLKVQKDKLSASLQALSDYIGGEHEHLTSLIREKADVVTDRLITQRKLDEANAKILLLELELKGLHTAGELSELEKSINKTDDE